jgi:hypothetical protein
MLIARDPVIANSPPGWTACDDALGKFAPPSELGFPCRAGDLNRFASRYRLAKSFKSIELDGYVQETGAGYSELFRVFLCYSAFEQFMDCCGLNLNGIEPFLPAYNANGCGDAIRKIEHFDQFLTAVLEHLDRNADRKQFQDFLAGRPCNPLFLAAGIRHIFAHGQLTPNAGAGYTRPAQEISKLLVILLFRVMDGEFTRRLNEHGIKT